MVQKRTARMRFARLYWRVRIETVASLRRIANSTVSPAFIGGCGLKHVRPAWDRENKLCFARLYWRVRIETTLEWKIQHVADCFARLYWRVRIETFADTSAHSSWAVSPAFIGGCGLKPA